MVYNGKSYIKVDDLGIPHDTPILGTPQMNKLKSFECWLYLPFSPILAVKQQMGFAFQLSRSRGETCCPKRATGCGAVDVFYSAIKIKRCQIILELYLPTNLMLG